MQLLAIGGTNERSGRRQRRLHAPRVHGTARDRRRGVDVARHRHRNIQSSAGRAPVGAGPKVHRALQHRVRVHRSGALLPPLARKAAPPGTRAPAAHRRDVPASLLSGGDVHVVARRADDRPPDRRQRHVRERRRTVGQAAFSGHPDRGSHAPQGRLLHGIQGQVASQQGFREHRSRSPVHHGDGRARVLRLRVARRRPRPRARRLQVRPHDRRQCGVVAAQQGAAARRRGQAVVALREPGEPARHHVPEHRCAWRERAGHRATDDARDTRARSPGLHGHVGSPAAEEPLPAVRRAGAAAGAWRIRQGVGVHARPDSPGAGALAALQRLLHQLHSCRRCAIAGDPRRARRAWALPEHDRRVHLRPRRDGRRPRPSREGCVRVRAEPAPALLRGASGRARRRGLPGADESRRCRAHLARAGRHGSRADRRRRGPRPARTRHRQRPRQSPRGRRELPARSGAVHVQRNRAERQRAHARDGRGDAGSERIRRPC